MRVSVVAGLIVGVHVAVIGSVVMTQGCASTRGSEVSTTPAMVEPAPAPILPPSVAVVAQPAVQPISFPAIQPPVQPAPLKTSVGVENVYVVKTGDSLSKIALAHGVNSRELAELNQITDPNKVRIGQKLILPDHSKPSQSQPAEKSSTKVVAKESTASGSTYVVKAGDALSKIAALHGVKSKDLLAANNITDANKIRVGQKLVIPGAKVVEKTQPAKKEEKAEEKAVEKTEAVSAAPAVAPLPAPVLEAVPAVAPAVDVAPVAPAAPSASQEAMLDYTVQDGDTSEGIARLFVVRKADILRVNGIPEGSDVKAGQKIKIPPSSL